MRRGLQGGERTRSDMLEIGLMIRRDNASRARTFVDELYARCVDLQFAPRAYPPLSGYEETVSADVFTETI